MSKHEKLLNDPLVINEYKTEEDILKSDLDNPGKISKLWELSSEEEETKQKRSKMVVRDSFFDFVRETGNEKLYDLYCENNFEELYNKLSINGIDLERSFAKMKPYKQTYFYDLDKTLWKFVNMSEVKKGGAVVALTFLSGKQLQFTKELPLLSLASTYLIGAAYSTVKAIYGAVQYCKTGEKDDFTSENVLSFAVDVVGAAVAVLSNQKGNCYGYKPMLDKQGNCQCVFGEIGDNQNYNLLMSLVFYGNLAIKAALIHKELSKGKDFELIEKSRNATMSLLGQIGEGFKSMLNDLTWGIFSKKEPFKVEFDKDTKIKLPPEFDLQKVKMKNVKFDFELMSDDLLIDQLMNDSEEFNINLEGIGKGKQQYDTESSPSPRPYNSDSESLSKESSERTYD